MVTFAAIVGGRMETSTSTARCPRHPENSASGACERCGTFFCELDQREVSGRVYCQSCAALADVDYLEAFRKKYWGKRDAWAWLLGAGGALNAVTAAFSAASGQVGAAAVQVAAAALGICFWLGLRFARIGVVLLNAALAVWLFAQGAGAGLFAGVWPFALSLAMIANTRNKLFFKMDVPRETLQKAWHLYHNNIYARIGFMLSFIGLIAFPLAAVALGLSLVGLRRVDPKAHPPIGRRGQAIAGVVLGALGLLIGPGLLLWTWLSSP